MRYHLFRFVVFLFLGLVAACSDAPMTSGGPSLGAPLYASADPSVEPPQEVEEYRLGSGDKLRISVFGEDALSGEFVVNDAGQVSFPLIGTINAAGLTLPQLQRAIEAKLADGYVKQPRVAAEVLNYRPFFILGEVNKPGEYPYSVGMTVVNAVARAEGFTYRADKRNVYIKRSGSDKEEEFRLTTTLKVQPGDTIRIKERFF